MAVSFLGQFKMPAGVKLYTGIPTIATPQQQAAFEASPLAQRFTDIAIQRRFEDWSRSNGNSTDMQAFAAFEQKRQDEEKARLAAQGMADIEKWRIAQDVQLGKRTAENAQALMEAAARKAESEGYGSASGGTSAGGGLAAKLKSIMSSPNFKLYAAGAVALAAVGVGGLLWKQMGPAPKASMAGLRRRHSKRKHSKKSKR